MTKKYSVPNSLIWSNRMHEGKERVFIQSPATGKMIMLSPAQAKVVFTFETEMTISEACIRLKEDGISISTEKLLSYVEKMNSLGIIVDSHDNGIQNPKVKRGLQLGTGKSWIEKLLYIKLPLIDTERWIGGLSRSLSSIYTPVGFILILTLSAAGIYTYLSDFSPWTAKIFTGSLSKNVLMLCILYLITIGTSFLHELAHAVTCRHYGGIVKEIGFLIIYFKPGLYCDVTSSYLFESKKDRMMVPLAGIIMDFTIWSSIILAGKGLLLLGYDPYILPAFGLFGFVTILFELNPLIKLDGYYVLTEITGIYNLRERSFNHIKQLLLHQNTEQSGSKANTFVFSVYAVMAGVYSVGLILWSLSVLERVLTQHFGQIGKAGAIVLVILLSYDFIMKIGKPFIRMFSKSFSERRIRHES